MAFGFLPVLVSASPEKLKEARTTIGEWVQVESAISRETLDWAEEKKLLHDLIQVQKARIARLEGNLAETESVVSAADQVRADLLEKSDANESRAKRITEFVSQAERDIRKLWPRLPEPLQAELAPLFQRLPSDAGTTSLGLGERMQTVTALLAKIRQFDGRITVSERIGIVPGSSAEASIRTLWFGLGQAYYLAPGDAGFGTPGRDGWEWHSRPEFTERIRESLALAESPSGTPKWINLPVSLPEGGTQ